MYSCRVPITIVQRDINVCEPCSHSQTLAYEHHCHQLLSKQLTGRIDRLHYPSDACAFSQGAGVHLEHHQMLAPSHDTSLSVSLMPKLGTGVCLFKGDLAPFAARMSRTLAYFFRCLRLLIGRRCYSKADLAPFGNSWVGQYSTSLISSNVYLHSAEVFTDEQHATYFPGCGMLEPHRQP